jgi:hypothetical protein
MPNFATGEGQVLPPKKSQCLSQKPYSKNYLIFNTITNEKKKSNKDDPTGRISTM